MLHSKRCQREQQTSQPAGFPASGVPRIPVPSVRAPSSACWLPRDVLAGDTSPPSGHHLGPQVADMGQEEYKRTWQQYINAFAEALIAPGADNPESPAGQRMVSASAAACPHLCSMRTVVGGRAAIQHSGRGVQTARVQARL